MMLKHIKHTYWKGGFLLEYEGWKVGQEIRQFRKAKRMTIEEFSFRLGVSPSHLNQLELGNRKMSIDLLYRIMEELNVDANTILVIPAKEGSFIHVSIDKQLERVPEEKRKYLEAVFQYMIKTLPE